MNTRTPRLLLGPFGLSILTLVGGCSSSASDQPLSQPVQDAAVDRNEPTDAVAGDSSDVFVVPDAGCASGILCSSQGLCCAVGETCEQDLCRPACESNVYCGSGCCEAHQVCLDGTCASPTTACNDSFDCTDQEYCEPLLSKCVPQLSNAGVCQYRPPVLPFEPILEWSWTGSDILPDMNQMAQTPIVADLDGDRIPEVITVTYRPDPDPGTGQYGGVVRAIDGRTGLDKWPSSVDAFKPDNYTYCGTPAVADITGDGVPEIVVPWKSGGLIAFHDDGSLLWRSTLSDGVTFYEGECGSYNFSCVAPSIAHMDGDSSPEIIAGGVIFDAQGHVKVGLGRECLGDNGGYIHPTPVIADVDGNGIQDLIGGNHAYHLDGSTLWEFAGSDGFPAIADFDQDGSPELLVISGGAARIHRAATGELLATLAAEPNSRGGPPTIADFDGDGKMEFSSAFASNYMVFEYESSPAPSISIKWKSPTQDQSSNATGSSVFDFEADGRAEVLYNDECFFRVYDGQTGTVLFKQASSTGTMIEYPIVVDVDGDNNSEILTTSNDHGPLRCASSYGESDKPRHGLFVYGDKNDKWARTRRIWNQHTYHITNINADGTLPAPEPASWGPNGFNNYRVSAQGKDVYNAPDLQVDLEVSTLGCPTHVTLRARISNRGTLGVDAGVQVSFYRGTGAAKTLLQDLATSKPLLPGQSETLELKTELLDPPTYTVTVDQSSSGSVVNECVEDNNEIVVENVRCPSVR